MLRRGCDARPVDAGEVDCCEGVTGHGWVGEQGVDGAGASGVGGGGGDWELGRRGVGIGGMYGLNITGDGWLNMEI